MFEPTWCIPLSSPCVAVFLPRCRWILARTTSSRAGSPRHPHHHCPYRFRTAPAVMQRTKRVLTISLCNHTLLLFIITIIKLAYDTKTLDMAWVASTTLCRCIIPSGSATCLCRNPRLPSSSLHQTYNIPSTYIGDDRRWFGIIHFLPHGSYGGRLRRGRRRRPRR